MTHESMKLIGIEEHFLTEDVRAAWNVAPVIDPIAALHSGTIEARLLDAGAARIELMDETGLDVQVLSLTSPALHNLERESIALAQRTNDAVAAVVAAHPTRFEALATLPVTAPGAAARELERCVRSLGFKGAMLCGRVGERNLDDAAFRPIFDAAHELDVPILLHPQIPVAAVREAYYSGFSPDVDLGFATYGIGWHYETGIQLVRLILAGTFDRLPRLQVILGHWGELVLFYAERLAALDRSAKLARPIREYLRNNLYVTASGIFLPTYLRRAIEVVGPDRILFSTDYPYQYRLGHDARRFIESCGLGLEDQAKLAHGNWERLTPNSRV